MTYRMIENKWRHRPCTDIGVDADYHILEYKYKDGGWRVVGTCHSASIAVFKRDGVKPNAELIKL
jgi:hypothetical protein